MGCVEHGGGGVHGVLAQAVSRLGGVCLYGRLWDLLGIECFGSEEGAP